MNAEITTHFEVTSKIADVCDTSANRYAMSAVRVTPSSEDETVYLEATDGRILAVIPVPGKTDKRILIPKSAFPKKRAKIGSPFVLVNGEYRNSDGLASPIGETQGRFPRTVDVLPAVDPDSAISPYLAVPLNADYLLTLAMAIGNASTSDAPGVTLFVPIPMKNGYPDFSQFVSAPIPVASINGDGIGVIMPMSAKGEAGNAKARYESARKAFVQASGAANAVDDRVLSPAPTEE